jgi:prepilin-type N-terminal cleavage/methylation domain-containing protein
MNRGFTLIEMTVVLAIVAVLALVSVPFFSLLNGMNGDNTVKNDVIGIVKIAQSQAQWSYNNSRYGVYFSGNSYKLYTGNSYAARTVALDRTYNLPAGSNFGAVLDINFANKTGLPSTTGAITITSSKGNVVTFNINAQGLIY